MGGKSVSANAHDLVIGQVGRDPFFRHTCINNLDWMTRLLPVILNGKLLSQKPALHRQHYRVVSTTWCRKYYTRHGLNNDDFALKTLASSTQRAASNDGLHLEKWLLTWCPCDPGSAREVSKVRNYGTG